MALVYFSCDSPETHKNIAPPFTSLQHLNIIVRFRYCCQQEVHIL